MIFESNGKSFGVNDRLYKQLQQFTTKALKKKDNNKIIIICGDTGIGKSTLAFQMAAVCDPTFCLDNISFTNLEMQQALKDMENKAHVFDEAFRGIGGRSVLNKEQKNLLQMFYEIRQLNQVIFLVSPSFFRLDEAIAVELADALIYVFKTKSGRRSFRLFNKKRKAKLYYMGKKGIKSYAQVYSGFNGHFPNEYVVEEQAYRDKKKQSLFYGKENEEVSTPKDNKAKDREARLWATLVKLSGSYGKASRAAKEMGIDLVKGTIQAKVAQDPQLHAKVVGK